MLLQNKINQIIAEHFGDYKLQGEIPDARPLVPIIVSKDKYLDERDTVVFIYNEIKETFFVVFRSMLPTTFKHIDQKLEMLYLEMGGNLHIGWFEKHSEKDCRWTQRRQAFCGHIKNIIPSSNGNYFFANCSDEACLFETSSDDASAHGWPIGFHGAPFSSSSSKKIKVIEDLDTDQLMLAIIGDIPESTGQAETHFIQFFSFLGKRHGGLKFCFSMVCPKSLKLTANDFKNIVCSLGSTDAEMEVGAQIKIKDKFWAMAK